MCEQRADIALAMCAVWCAGFYHACIRPWMYTWGASNDEVNAWLPGDELCTPDVPRTTRAITIAAPAQAIWPWLVQIGEDRAGFYSYSLLERAVGADIHNANRIHPQWQQLHVGDTIWLARRYGPAARQLVTDVAADSHLVLVSPVDFARLNRGEKASGTWSFHLRNSTAGTRLVARGSGGAVGHFWFDIPHFLMEQKMMRGIRTRVMQSKTTAPSIVLPTPAPGPLAHRSESTSTGAKRL